MTEPNRTELEAGLDDATHDAYNAGYKDGAKGERERILNQMALERCDPDVMLYFEDYYYLPKSIWQALKDKEE